MAPSIAYTLPAMQLVCNLVMPVLNISNTGPTVPESPSRIQFENIPDGYVPHPEIGTAYKIYTETVSWKIAKQRCIQEGANLAVIDSWLKFEYLLNQTEVASIIVGVHSMYDDTEWVSATTGSALANLPWAASEPSGGHDCVYSTRSPRGLRNYGCTTTANFACELPISNNHNTLGDLKRISAN